MVDSGAVKSGEAPSLTHACFLCVSASSVGVWAIWDSGSGMQLLVILRKMELMAVYSLDFFSSYFFVLKSHFIPVFFFRLSFLFF